MIASRGWDVCPQFPPILLQVEQAGSTRKWRAGGFSHRLCAIVGMTSWQRIKRPEEWVRRQLTVHEPGVRGDELAPLPLGECDSPWLARALATTDIESQTRTVRSLEAETSRAPSGLQAT